jgi:hypothetical protein
VLNVKDVEDNKPTEVGGAEFLDEKCTIVAPVKPCDWCSRIRKSFLCSTPRSPPSKEHSRIYYDVFTMKQKIKTR